MLALVGCSNDDNGSANGPCGPNGACPAGFTCEARTNICLANSTPDARVFDGGTGSTIDAGGGSTIDAGGGNTIDAGGGSAPDAGSSSGPVTTLTPDFTSPTNRTSLNFTFTASIAGATFECSIDGDAFAACTSPLNHVFADGRHTLSVRATAGGVHETTPPSDTFQVDSTPPVISINSPVDGAMIGNSTLVFASNEPLSAFRCKFDSADFASCGSGSSGTLPIDLANGPHTAQVTGTDVAGNPGNTATVSFTFDSTALSVNITPRQTECTSETVAFNGNKEGATFTCSLDGTVTDPCTSPFTLPQNIAAGAHSLVVNAALAGATASNTLNFDIDLTPPLVNIISVFPDNADTNGNFDRQGTIFYTTNKPGISAECSVDGESSDCTSRFAEGQFSYGPLSDSGNPHGAAVTVTDACGRTATDNFGFGVDSTAPEPCIVQVATASGPTQGSGTCLTTGKSGPTGTLLFDSEPGDYACTLHTVSAPPKLPGEPPITSIGPFTCQPGTAIPFNDLTDFGLNGLVWTLTIQGIDVHGNFSVTDLSWTVDATSPQVAFGAASTATSGADGTLTIPFTLTPAADATGATYPVCSLDGVTCTCGGAPLAMRCSQVSAGDHVASVQARDQFTNRGVQTTSSGTTPFVMRYGPNAGRLILIGHDFESENGNTTAILAAALADTPWNKDALFGRKPRVLFLAPPDGADPALANVQDDWAGLVDTNSTVSIDDFNDLAVELRGHDILFVFDQNNPQASAAVGAVWNTPAGTETPLTHFLNAGGTVIVLDGLGLGSEPDPSETFRVVSSGAAPALNATNADFVDTNSTIFYVATLNELRDTPDLTFQSDLKGLLAGAPPRAIDSYRAPDTSVGFQLGDDEIATGQPRIVYIGECLSEGCTPPPVVLEKIFPVYSLAVAASTNPLGSYPPGTTIPFTLTPASDVTTTCTLQCQDSEECSCAVGTICSCPTGPSGPQFPTVTGPYTVEFMTKSDPDGRPGRVLSLSLLIQLNIETLVVDDPASDSGGKIICARVASVPAASLSWDNGFDAQQDNPVSASCAGYQYSFHLNRCGTEFGDVDVSDTRNGNSGFAELEVDFGECPAKK